MKSFDDLLSYFPKIDPPFTLTDDSVHYISFNNEVLPFDLIEEYINSWEDHKETEFTEYLPCIKLEIAKNIFGLIYWKADLLKYEFILVTVNEKGEKIARKIICGTAVDEKYIKKSVATIEKDLIIKISAGIQPIDTNDYNVNNTQNFTMEIMENGEIVFEES